jgi:thiol-disulfide isomerase/thioredoxin
MKSFKLLTIILFLLVGLNVSAQTVSGTLFNLPQQKVYLNAYTGLGLETVDSVMLSQDKRVDFNAQLAKGMYQIETEYGFTFDFLYDNKSVKFVLRDINKLEEIEFIDSQLNTDWYRYLVFKAQIIESQDLLKPLLRSCDKKTEFYINAKNEYQKLQNSFVAFTDSLLKNNNYASTLIRVDRFVPLNLDVDFEKQRKELTANFFNEVDFTDLSLIPTNVLTTKIIDFLSIQQVAGQTRDQQIMAIVLGIDNVLYRASVSFDMYKFVFQYLMEGFNVLGYEEIVDYMTRIPYSEELQCNENQYDELLSIVEFNSRVKIGSKAKNISGKTIFDEDFSMYDIDSKFTIVFFWSYTCEHCRENIVELKLFLDENPDFSLVAVSVKGDLKKIKNIVKKNKVGGFFYHDGLEWNCPYINDYAVTATPCFYLLDKDKKIVFKPFDFEELVEFVNIIKQ